MDKRTAETRNPAFTWPRQVQLLPFQPLIYCCIFFFDTQCSPSPDRDSHACRYGFPDKQAASSPAPHIPSTYVRGASPPPLQDGSDDTDGPVSRRARRLAIAIASKRVAVAAASPPPPLDGSSSDDADTIGDDNSDDNSDDPVDLVFPPDSPRSLEDSNSDNSLDDFIDKTEPKYTLWQQKQLMRLFPITCKHMLDNGE